MPAPADVQTADGGGKNGRAQKNDRITFTYAGPVDPSLIVAGWNGSATSVTVRIANNGKNDNGTTSTYVRADVFMERRY